MTDDVLLLGIDLGTSRSSIVGLNGTRKTIDSYVGYPKDAVSRKMLKTDVLYGKAALDNRLALNLYRPLEKGVIKGTYEGNDAGTVKDKEEGEKNLKAARDLLAHLVDLCNPGRDQLIYGVVGVPAQATGKNKTAILDATKEIFDSVMIVSEPFTVAYGMQRMSDVLVVDIGAGTTDLCRMHGTVPGPDDEISFTIAGDAVDTRLYELIKNKYPSAQLTQNMCKQFKEQYGYVSDSKDKIEVTIPVDGRAHAARHHRRDEAGLRNSRRPDRRRDPQARQQLQPRVPGSPAEQHPAGRRRRADARIEQAHRRRPLGHRLGARHRLRRAGVRRRERRPAAGHGHARRVLAAAEVISCRSNSERE